MTRVSDEPLRIRALEVLGPLGDATAREVLERGTLEVEHDVAGWEGSLGGVRAHRVFVVVEEPLAARYASTHAAADALTASLAAALGERTREALADVRVEAGEAGMRTAGAGSPYRNPRVP